MRQVSKNGIDFVKKFCYDFSKFFYKGQTMAATAREINYNELSIRKLLGLFDNAEKQNIKLQSEIKRIWNKIDEVNRRKMSIAKAMAIKAEQPSDRLKKAIEEVTEMEKNPNNYPSYSNAEEMIKACLND